ncbi:hypothetical protein FGO68_gene16224 [Halteria grandinella]|uniref:Uncharacterized protein n=1 Tax=Halteria grandinella TaxID=5974 RepID=A0A8J8T2V2_HALGN|nr:hypothetical protein FGO68_gene16224 [Halteria grandinella]
MRSFESSKACAFLRAWYSQSRAWNFERYSSDWAWQRARRFDESGYWVVCPREKLCWCEIGWGGWGLPTL